MSGRPCNDIEIGGTVSGKITIDLVLETGGYGDFMRCDAPMAKRIAERLTQVVGQVEQFASGTIPPKAETPPGAAIEVHGLILQPGDFYFGYPPNKRGFWGASHTEYYDWKKQSILVWISDSECDSLNPQMASMSEKQRYWMYLGPLPSIGECKQKPADLVVGETYELSIKSINNTWTYRFKNQALNRNTGMNEDWYWFSSPHGDEMAHVVRGEIVGRCKQQ